MTLIVDKRLLPKNQTSGSRQKFIDRYKQTIKKRIKDIVGKSSIKDLTKSDKKIKIKAQDLDEPEFGFQSGTGNTDRIYIGNKIFKKGQKIKRPPGGNGQGNKGSPDGEGQDDFEFDLSEKEFSDLFFEDLALPDLLKKEFTGSNFEIKPAGYSRTGGPASLNVRKTMINALGRKLALKNRLALLEEEIRLKKKIQYIEDLDLRYNFRDKVDVPETRAVMFCLMDVSGSMGELEKDLAKRFFILLSMFLRRNYEIVDIVFVRHSEHAEECTEEVFFHDRATGGTIISTGYDKILEIIKNKYDPEKWNIYVAQASDGENWLEDMETMEATLVRYLLPVCQYFAYMDIQARMFNTNGKSDVLKVMEKLMLTNRNLQARVVEDYKDIFPVFRSLFKKEK